LGGGVFKRKTNDTRRKLNRQTGPGGGQSRNRWGKGKRGPQGTVVGWGEDTVKKASFLGVQATESNKIAFSYRNREKESGEDGGCLGGLTSSLSNDLGGRK